MVFWVGRDKLLDALKNDEWSEEEESDSFPSPTFPVGEALLAIAGEECSALLLSVCKRLSINLARVGLLYGSVSGV